MAGPAETGQVHGTMNQWTPRSVDPTVRGHFAFCPSQLSNHAETMQLPFAEWISEHWPLAHRVRLALRFQRHRRQRHAAQVVAPWELPERHTLIASFPRSGNTWLSHLVADVLLQQQGYVTGTKLPVNERQVLPDLDRGDLAWANHGQFAPQCICKTHLVHAAWMHKGVFLFRHPADTLLSYYHFHLRYPERRAAAAQGPDSFCKATAGEWYLHARSFLDACRSGANRFHAISYESLLSDTPRTLRRVLGFLGIKASDEHVRTAIDHHRFENHARREVENDCDHAPTRSRFFRQGKQGAAQVELKPDTLRWIDSICGRLYLQAIQLEDDSRRQLAA